jgi:uncharacterized protein
MSIIADTLSQLDVYLLPIEETIRGQINTDWKEALITTFRQAFVNTLETTVELHDDGTTFVITGDIPAMWLRDSSAQVKHYLPLTKNDPHFQRLVRGLIQRQALYLNIDPYANAFNREANSAGHIEDITEHNPYVWERKYELDSLCFPVQLLADYVTISQDKQVFTPEVHTMFRRIVQTMRTEQHHHERSNYRFERPTEHLYSPMDTLPFAGRGTSCNTTGMVWSGFRPSDDACTFGYLIPANLFASVILGHIARFAKEIYVDTWLANEATQLKSEILFGINTYGLVNHPKYGRMYAYETDGFGNYVLMDDANVPSLLSLPYLGVCEIDNPIYQNTRAFVLSMDNPHYHTGKVARGVGSPHTGNRNIWHIGLTMQALTTKDPNERLTLLEMLVKTTAGTNYMHESFDPNNPSDFTRSWFAWANSLFAEFVSKEFTQTNPKERYNGNR